MDRSDTDRARRSPAPAWVVTGVVVLASLLQLARGSGVPVWRSVFGEDGGIFLTEALASRGWGSLFTPYQGYLQVASRLVAEVVAMLPLSFAAVALAGISALLVALLSVFIYSASATLFETRWARVAVAAAPLVLPAAYETTSNATDLHWYLDYACFFALAAGFRSRRLVASAAVVAGLAVLSDPLAGLFLPLAVWRVVVAFGYMPARDRPFVRRQSGGRRLVDLVVPVTVVLGLLLQIAFGMAKQHADHFGTSNVADVPAAYGLRVSGSFLFGDRFLAGAFVSIGKPFAFGCLALVAVGAAFAVRRRSSRTLVLLACGYSVLWLCVPLVLRGSSAMLPRAVEYLGGSRYTVVPILLLVVACVAWLDRLRTTPRAVATVGFLVVVALSFTLASQRTDGPVWSDSLAAARQQCAATGDRPNLPGRSAEAPWGLPARPTDTLILVAPSKYPQWYLRAPCARLG